MVRANQLKSFYKVVKSEENALFKSPCKTLGCVGTAWAVEVERVEAENEVEPR